MATRDCLLLFPPAGSFCVCHVQVGASRRVVSVMAPVRLSWMTATPVSSKAAALGLRAGRTGRGQGRGHLRDVEINTHKHCGASPSGRRTAGARGTGGHARHPARVGRFVATPVPAGGLARSEAQETCARYAPEVCSGKRLRFGENGRLGESRLAAGCKTQPGVLHQTSVFGTAQPGAVHSAFEQGGDSCLGTSSAAAATSRLRVPLRLPTGHGHACGNGQGAPRHAAARRAAHMRGAQRPPQGQP